jgi:hypothetical protein
MQGPGIASRHWISVDLAWPAAQGILHPAASQSHLSVYEVTLPDSHPAARYRHHDFIWVGNCVPLAQAGLDGEPLYGKEALSFPPLDAVCMHGSAAVEAWMASFGLRRI